MKGIYKKDLTIIFILIFVLNFSCIHTKYYLRNEPTEITKNYSYVTTIFGLLPRIVIEEKDICGDLKLNNFTIKDNYFSGLLAGFTLGLIKLIFIEAECGK